MLVGLYLRICSFKKFSLAISPETDLFYAPASPSPLHSVEEQTEPGAECQTAATEGLFKQTQLRGGSYG